MHPLMVHLTTVAVPTAAILAILVAVVPFLRRRWLNAAMLVTTIATMSVPLASSSGEALERTTEHSALLQKHTELADTLLPVMGALFVLMAAFWVIHRLVLRSHRPAPIRRTTTTDAEGRTVPVRDPRRPMRIVAVVLSILIVIASIAVAVDVVAIGHAGAVSVWKG